MAHFSSLRHPWQRLLDLYRPREPPPRRPLPTASFDGGRGSFWVRFLAKIRQINGESAGETSSAVRQKTWVR